MIGITVSPVYLTNVSNRWALGAVVILKSRKWGLAGGSAAVMVRIEAAAKAAILAVVKNCLRFTVGLQNYEMKKDRGKR